MLCANVINSRGTKMNRKDASLPYPLLLMSSLSLRTPLTVFHLAIAQPSNNSSIISSQMLSLDIQVWLSALFLCLHD